MSTMETTLCTQMRKIMYYFFLFHWIRIYLTEITIFNGFSYKIFKKKIGMTIRNHHSLKLDKELVLSLNLIGFKLFISLTEAKINTITFSD